MTKRSRLTKFEYATIFLAQNGKCGCGCGQRLESKKVDEEHTIPNAIKEGKPDALWLRECHRKKKTPKDRKVIAKINRLLLKTGQQARRAKNGSRLKSRGFDKTLRKKFNGEVERK